jgi:hypothetical protein
MPRCRIVLALWLAGAVGLTSPARAQGVAIVYVRALSDTCSIPPSAKSQTLAQPIAFSPDLLSPPRPVPVAAAAGARRPGIQYVFFYLAPGEYLLVR